MNWKRKVSLGLILMLILDSTIIRAEEKVSVSQVTMEETVELIQADPKLAVEFYKFLARTYIREKKYEEAARTYQKALEIAPKDESLRLALAHLYDWQIEDPRRTALEYEKLIDINPEKSEYYTRLAELYLQMGLKEKAIPFLERVAKARPDDAYIYSKLGELYLSRGMYSKAVQAYKEAIRLKPEETKFRLELAQAYQECGKYEEALKEYTGVLEVTKSEEERNLLDEWLWENIGLYDVWGAVLIRAEHLGMLSDLTKKFKKKVAQHPNNSLLRKDLARIYTWEGDYEKAIIQCLEAIRINPKDNVAWYRLGRIYERKKDFIPAIKAYLEIIVKDLGRRGFSRGLAIDMRNNWAALKRIEKITEKRALYPEVIEEVETAIERNPTQVELYWLLANLYHGEKSYHRAIKTYQKIIEQEPYRKSEIYRRIGDIYVENKQYEEAITSYEEILTLFQSDPAPFKKIEAFKKIFLVYEKMGRVEEKLREYEEKITREPENIELYQVLGGIYEALERWEEGSRLYLKALEIAPQNREIERNSRLLAYRCKRNGALKAALPLFQKFREREPARAQYTIALIEIYIGLGEKEKARSLLEEFSQKESKSLYELRNIARLYQQQGEHALAEEYYRKAREMRPWYRSQYSFKLVRASLAEGNYEKAEELLREGIRLAPNQPAPYLSLAELYRKGGKYRKAKALYKEILGRTEKDWTMDHTIEDIHEALLEVKKKSILRAIAREYEKKLKRDPQNIDLGNYLAQIYKRIEEVQKEIEPVEEPLSIGEYGYYEFVGEIE
ncbi:tetratricopeptide repeat protein [bacterium]|nr:tetratricopeptide repeat protein [bacterium]